MNSSTPSVFASTSLFHQIAERFKYLGSPSVGSTSLCMLATIDLDNEICLQAGKIDDEPIDRNLALELETEELPIAKLRPQLSLSSRRLAP